MHYTLTHLSYSIILTHYKQKVHWPMVKNSQSSVPRHKYI